MRSHPRGDYPGGCALFLNPAPCNELSVEHRLLFVGGGPMQG